jgi:RNA polymerase sigma factor (sigma-70 family)
MTAPARRRSASSFSSAEEERAIDGYLHPVGEAPSYPELKHRLLSSAEELQATPEELVRHNLRLVMGIATKYRGRGVDLTDLYSEGLIGLMRAAERYDPWFGGRDPKIDTPIRFSTHATWWVRQAVLRAIDNQSSTVRLPVWVRQELVRWRRGDASTQEEENLRTWEQHMTGPFCLDAPLSTGSDLTLLDAVTGGAPPPDARTSSAAA